MVVTTVISMLLATYLTDFSLNWLLVFQVCVFDNGLKIVSVSLESLASTIAGLFAPRRAQIRQFKWSLILII